MPIRFGSKIAWATIAAGFALASLTAVAGQPGTQSTGTQVSCANNTTQASACDLPGPNFTQRGALIARSQAYKTNQHDYYRFSVNGPVTLLITITNLTNPACSTVLPGPGTYMIRCGFATATLEDARGHYIDSTLGSTPLNGHKVAANTTPTIPGPGIYYVVVTGMLAGGVHGTENTLYLLKVKTIPTPNLAPLFAN